MTRDSNSLATAVAKHRAGKLAEAEAGYRSILSVEPHHVAALHCLGVLATQTGRVALAVESLDAALAVAGPQGTLHYHRAVALERAGRVDEAIESYQQAVELCPRVAQAALRLSRLLLKAGQHVVAARVLARATRLHPSNAEIACELGMLLLGIGQPGRALAHFKRAVALDPRQVPALIHGGDCWLAQGRADRAIEWYQRALALCPDSISARNNLGSAWQAQGLLTDAIEQYRQVLQGAPDSFEARVNLATALHQQGDSVAALDELRTAIVCQPEKASAYTNLGAIHEDLGQFTQAMQAYDRAVALAPRDADAHLHRALLLVQREQFAAGWDEYEWRFQTRADQCPRRFACPAWDGGSLSDRTIFIHGEQGIGDEIMFATCLPDVIERARQVSISCDQRLAGLFQRSFPRAVVRGVERGKEAWPLLAGGADCHLPAGSLPRFFRRSTAEFPRREQLLVPDPQRVGVWRRRLQAVGSGLRVGIAWRGGANSNLLDGSGQGAGYRAQSRRRSCGLQEWHPLLATEGVQFVNLQYGATRDELSTISPEHASRFHSFEEVDLRSDLDELAALIGALDLVISVGNATAHLAGAVGIATWAVLPKFWGWRWSYERSDCLWYSRVSVWRQRELGDWSELLTRVARALRGVSARRAARGARSDSQNRNSVM